MKHETPYTETLKIGGNGQTFKAFYLSASALMFEVNLSVSKGSIKWAPYSATLFEDTLELFPYRIDSATVDVIQGWECETHNGKVKWRVDPENLNQVWYLSFLNEDSYEKEVYVEVTKV
ncbi:hypothetical protein MUO98_04085 [Candidatus Bathyarchaeota archaeon]|nr:hypothetical protein [Candidatus Bathyarchaeota archaeon]